MPIGNETVRWDWAVAFLFSTLSIYLDLFLLMSERLSRPLLLLVFILISLFCSLQHLHPFLRSQYTSSARRHLASADFNTPFFLFCFASFWTGISTSPSRIGWESKPGGSHVGRAGQAQLRCYDESTTTMYAAHVFHFPQSRGKRRNEHTS